MPCVSIREAICKFLDDKNCLITTTRTDLFALLCPGAEVYVIFFMEIGYIKLAYINMYDNTHMI